MILKGKYFP